MSTDAKVGAKIRNLRQRSDISLRQLARDADVSVSYLSSIEKDAVSPTLATLRKILVALGSSFSEFFNEEESNSDRYFFHKSGMHTVADNDRAYTFILPRRDDIALEMMDENYSAGRTMPEFEVQEYDFYGYVVGGTITLEIGEEPPARLGSGDAFFVPAGTRSRGYCENGESARVISVLNTANRRAVKEEKSEKIK